MATAARRVQHLARFAPDVSVVDFDHSPRGLAELRQRLEVAGVADEEQGRRATSNLMMTLSVSEA